MSDTHPAQIGSTSGWMPLLTALSSPMLGESLAFDRRDADAKMAEYRHMQRLGMRYARPQGRGAA